MTSPNKKQNIQNQISDVGWFLLTFLFHSTSETSLGFRGLPTMFFDQTRSWLTTSDGRPNTVTWSNVVQRDINDIKTRCNMLQCFRINTWNAQKPHLKSHEPCETCNIIWIWKNLEAWGLDRIGPGLHLSAGPSTKVIPIPTAGRGRTFAGDLAPGDLQRHGQSTNLTKLMDLSGSVKPTGTVSTFDFQPAGVVSTPLFPRLCITSLIQIYSFTNAAFPENWTSKSVIGAPGSQGSKTNEKQKVKTDKIRQKL